MTRKNVRARFGAGNDIRKLFASVLLLVASTLTFGQTSTSIRGNVADENGAKIGGAEVRLISRNGSQLSTTTDNNGAFVFSNLPLVAT